MYHLNHFQTLQVRGVTYVHRVVQPSPSSTSGTFHLKNPRLCAHKPSLPSSPSPAPSALLCVSAGVSLLGTSGKWYHTVPVFLSPASFSGHSVFKAHPCCSVRQIFFLFQDKYYSLAWTDCIVFIHSFIRRRGLLPPSAVVNTAAMNTGAQM